MTRLEQYAWMKLGYGHPGFADTAPITLYTVTGSGRVNPRAPREDQLGHRARRARVRDRLRMLLVRPGKDRRDHEQDKRKDAEHSGTSLRGSYPELGPACQLTVPGARWTAGAASGRTPAETTTLTVELVTATDRARSRDDENA